MEMYKLQTSHKSVHVPAPHVQTFKCQSQTQIKLSMGIRIETEFPGRFYQFLYIIYIINIIIIITTIVEHSH